MTSLLLNSGTDCADSQNIICYTSKNKNLIYPDDVQLHMLILAQNPVQIVKSCNISVKTSVNYAN